MGSIHEATLVRGRARTPNGNQNVSARMARDMIGQYRFIFVLRVVIVRISHAMRARHVGAYASPFLTMQDPYGISRVWPFGCRRHPAWVATLVRVRARTPNGNQQCFRTHGTRYDRAISIYIRALRVVIVRISHAMGARHVVVMHHHF